MHRPRALGICSFWNGLEILVVGVVHFYEQLLHLLNNHCCLLSHPSLLCLFKLFWSDFWVLESGKQLNFALLICDRRAWSATSFLTRDERLEHWIYEFRYHPLTACDAWFIVFWDGRPVNDHICLWFLRRAVTLHALLGLCLFKDGLNSVAEVSLFAKNLNDAEGLAVFWLSLAGVHFYWFCLHSLV
jgi:hypothetical protein